MKTVDVQHAKKNLSRLVEEAAKGEEFVITVTGKPMVKVIPIADAPKKKRRAGFLEGQFSVPDDFDKMCAEEIEKMFYGE